MDYFEKFTAVLEDVSGVNTLPRTNMNSVKAKVLNVVFWLFMYSYELGQHAKNIFDGHEGTSVIQILMLGNYLWIFSVLYRSLARDRSIHSARLTLQAAKSQLVRAGIEIVPSKSTDFVLMAVIVIISVLSVPISFFISMYYGYLAQVITHYFTTSHFNIIFLTVSFGYVHSKLSCKTIYRSMNKALEDMRIPEDITGKGRKRKRNRETTANTCNNDHIELLVLIRKIKMAIINTEKEINAYYRTFILLNLTHIALLSPNVLCTLLTENSMILMFANGFKLLSISASLLSFVSASVTGASSKELPGLALKRFHTTRNEVHQTFLRRHVLSTIHFRDVGTSVFFDLEYSMIMDIMDYGIVVFTTLCLKYTDGWKRAT